jgi:hypothetical protein
MPPFTVLLGRPRCVQIMQPCVDFRPHLLLILILLPLLLHLSHLCPQLFKHLPSDLVHQILPDNQVLLRFYRPFLSSNHWQSMLPAGDSKPQEI